MDSCSVTRRQWETKPNFSANSDTNLVLHANKSEIGKSRCKKISGDQRKVAIGGHSSLDRKAHYQMPKKFLDVKLM